MKYKNLKQEVIALIAEIETTAINLEHNSNDDNCVSILKSALKLRDLFNITQSEMMTQYKFNDILDRAGYKHPASNSQKAGLSNEI